MGIYNYLEICHPALLRKAHRVNQLELLHFFHSRFILCLHVQGIIWIVFFKFMCQSCLEYFFYITINATNSNFVSESINSLSFCITTSDISAYLNKRHNCNQLRFVEFNLTLIKELLRKFYFLLSYLITFLCFIILEEPLVYPASSTKKV